MNETWANHEITGGEGLAEILTGGTVSGICCQEIAFHTSLINMPKCLWEGLWEQRKLDAIFFLTGKCLFLEDSGTSFSSLSQIESLW